MKSRETLIRLRKFQVDEKRRRVAQIESMVADFDRMAAELDREIETEQTRAGIHDPAHFAYPTYAKAALTRRKLTLQTGDLPVWEAIDLFCREAGLAEEERAVPAQRPAAQGYSVSLRVVGGGGGFAPEPVDVLGKAPPDEPVELNLRPGPARPAPAHVTGPVRVATETDAAADRIRSATAREAIVPHPGSTAISSSPP